MTTNNNAAQKILIDALITTHQNPAKAFKKALHTATTQKDGETLKRIAGECKRMNGVLWMKITK